VRIEGVAHLPDGIETQTWVMPNGPIPLRMEFDLQGSIGTAELVRHEDGTITCVAHIADPELTRLSLAPKFAVGLMRHGSGPWELKDVSLVSGNSNLNVPAYKVIPEDE